MKSDFTLDPPSKWAGTPFFHSYLTFEVSIYSGSGKQAQLQSHSKMGHPYQTKHEPPQPVPYESKGKARYTSFPMNVRAHGPMLSEAEIALTGISSSDQIDIDFERVLSIRKGDLAMIQREAFRCHSKIPYLEHIPLVLKKVECIDRRIYDLKVHESDLFMKYRGHPNFVSLYSYWAEPSSNRYTYRSLIQLFEEGTYGDMLGTLMMNPVAPAPRIVLKYMCDCAKALSTIHASNVIHGSVRPSNIYITHGNQAKLGEFKKVELDAIRQTNQLSSKILIGQAIPKALIYWAPELLTMDKYDTMVDMWALGVTFYQVATGEHPFNVMNEEQFRMEVLNGKVRWNMLKGYPIIGKAVQNLLQVLPRNRWTASQLLYYCQDYFAVEIQSSWRRFHNRREFKRMALALVKIQAHVKGFLTKIHYQRDRIISRENAALAIQKKFRSHDISRSYRTMKRALMKCQANVISRQMRRAFMKMKIDVMMGQAFIRRYLAVSWYRQLKKQRYSLENNLEKINSMIEQYNRDAQDFQDQFTTKKVGPNLNQIPNRGQYDKDYDADRNPPFGTAQASAQYQDLLEEKKELEKRLAKNPMQSNKDKEREPPEDDILYQHLKADHNPKRFRELQTKSKQLNIRLQHSYAYNQWDSVYEPSNVVENVLKDNDFVYKELNPVLDFTLHQGALCFISEIRIFGGEPGPGDIQIYISDSLDRWDFLMTYRCNKEAMQRILLKDETFAKFLRLKYLDNVRGGNLCVTRYIQVFGVPTQLLGPR